jgi:hypothetical protein
MTMTGAGDVGHHRGDVDLGEDDGPPGLKVTGVGAEGDAGSQPG